jgi:hypothetical protein
MFIIPYIISIVVYYLIYWIFYLLFGLSYLKIKERILKHKIKIASGELWLTSILSITLSLLVVYNTLIWFNLKVNYFYLPYPLLFIHPRFSTFITVKTIHEEGFRGLKDD